MSFVSKLFFKKDTDVLNKGLQKTKFGFWNRFNKIVSSRSTIDVEILDRLEEMLIASDVGVETTLKIVNNIENRVKRDKYVGADELKRILHAEMVALLSDDVEQKDGQDHVAHAKPHVIMIVGVNGAGKTTTVGKLAYKLIQGKKKVVLGAADTFRAAAVDQLQRWGERTGAEVYHKGNHADPSAVAYDTIKLGIEKEADVVIIDTAGRLHTKKNLMHELSKIRRVIGKAMPSAPHETLLVLDGSVGQNAIVQMREFAKVTPITGVIVAKLDGSAKGGVLVAISDEFNIPIKYIGVGEGQEDLQIFDKRAFVQALFGSN